MAREIPRSASFAKSSALGNSRWPPGLCGAYPLDWVVATSGSIDCVTKIHDGAERGVGTDNFLLSALDLACCCAAQGFLTFRKDIRFVYSHLFAGRRLVYAT